MHKVNPPSYTSVNFHKSQCFSDFMGKFKAYDCVAEQITVKKTPKLLAYCTLGNVCEKLSVYGFVVN